eukprot:m.415490 g.415490  ORF g.415490 m.415490 type:complete len:790 (+) comp29649_c0_seq1:106-2475(+)
MGVEETIVAVGFSESKAAEIARNVELAEVLLGLIGKAGGPPLDKSKGNLLFTIAQKFKSEKDREKKGEGMAGSMVEHTDALVAHIKADRLKSKAQLEAAFAFLSAGGSTVDDKFAAATGIGIVITEEDVVAAVKALLEGEKEALLANRYRTNVGMLLGQLGATLKWADGKLMKKVMDQEIERYLGPRTEADNAKPTKVKKVKEPKAAAAKGKGAAAAADEPVLSVALQGAAMRLHKVGGNDTSAGYVTTPRTRAHLDAHFKHVHGQVRTRFPPEPNGILHIGHAKAINFNFSYAAARDGITFLRYDDTNPEKEEERFFTGIKTDVEWLGWKPYKITHSSDYFHELFDYAVKLIESNLAYVCHMHGDALRGHDQVESPWSKRPVEESLALFQDMKDGLIDEGKATLRMRHTMKDGKIDPVAYRIKFCAHHRTGDTWCIYPTYDFTHCLVDSLEHITHSLCTKEFENRRPSYYWLCNAVDAYCPVQWEYSRLNVSYTVVSKRKIAKLIDHKFVTGWDDPRLYTLSALRRRGFPAEAITMFCNKLGVTDSTETVIDPSNLDSCVRDVLNRKAVRAMAAVEPLRVELVGAKASSLAKTVTITNNPVDDTMGSHDVSVCSVIYLSADDFQPADSKVFKRLTPTQPVGLKYLNSLMRVKEVVKRPDGSVEKLIATLEDHSPETKPKAYIHWVSSASPATPPQSAELRMYSRLFKHADPENPDVAPGGFVTDVDTDSLHIARAYVDATCTGAAVGTVFQFERTGYYCIDQDSSPDAPVFNLTVGLKGKGGAADQKK